MFSLNPRTHRAPRAHWAMSEAEKPMPALFSFMRSCMRSRMCQGWGVMGSLGGSAGKLRNHLQNNLPDTYLAFQAKTSPKGLS